MHALAWNNKMSPWEVKYYYGCEVDKELQDKLVRRLLPVAFPIVAHQSLFYNLIQIYQHRIRVRIFLSDMDRNHLLVNDRHPNGRYNLEMNMFDVEEGYIGASSDSKIKLRWHPECYEGSLIRRDMEDKEFHLPILCSHINSRRGSVIRPQQIVRIDYSNKNNGTVIWQHPDYEVIDNVLLRPNSVTIGA